MLLNMRAIRIFLWFNYIKQPFAFEWQNNCFQIKTSFWVFYENFLSKVFLRNMRLDLQGFSFMELTIHLTVAERRGSFLFLSTTAICLQNFRESFSILCVKSKIQGSHFTCIVANKCLNVHVGIELIKRNKNHPLLYPAVLCWSLSLIKRDFIKKRLQHRRFLVNIAKFSKIPVLKKQVKFAADIYKKDC